MNGPKTFISTSFLVLSVKKELLSLLAPVTARYTQPGTKKAGPPTEAG